MIKRRFHVTTSGSKRRARINPKLNRIKKRREAADMFNDMYSDEQRQRAPELQITPGVHFHPYYDEAMLSIGNKGGGILEFTIESIPSWVTVRNEDGADYDLMPDAQTKRLGPHEWITLFLDSSEASLPPGETTGQFTVSSTGGSAFATVTTNNSSPNEQPGSVSFSNVLDNTLTINWANACTNADEIFIYRNTSYIRPPTQTYSIQDGTATSFNDTGLQPNTDYWYWVLFSNADGESSPSTNAVRTLTLPDKKPLNLAFAAIAPTYATVKWDNNCSNETGVRVFLSLSNLKPAQPLITLPAASKAYNLTGLAQDTIHYVWVDFINEIGISADVDGNFATPQGIPDANPINMTFNNISSSNINVRWDNTCTNETAVEIWKNTINKPPKSPVVLAADTTSHNFVTLSPDTIYYFGVSFKNNYGATTDLTGSQATSSSWTDTGLKIQTNLNTGTTISMVDPHSGTTGIDIGDLLRLNHTDGKTIEEVLVTDTNMKNDTIIIQRGLNGTKPTSFPKGSVVEVNHPTIWYVAGNTGKDVSLDMPLDNKKTNFRTNLDVNQNRPFIEIDNLIKIDNEIMRVINLEVSKKTKAMVLVTVKSRGDQFTIAANHSSGASIYVNHK